MRSVRVIMAWLLVSLLTACGVSAGTSPTPSGQVIRQAIALQASQTQQQLSQQLQLESLKSGTIDIHRVQIKEQQPLVIQNLPAYRVQGTYDYTVKFSQRQVTQRNTPFEVYVQRQIEGKTWRLAQLQRSTGEKPATWATQLIQ